MPENSSGILQVERDLRVWYVLRREGSLLLTMDYYVIKISPSLLASRYTTRILTSEGRSAISVLAAPSCM